MAIRTAEEYHRVLELFPPIAEPAFENLEELENRWGRKWGANSDIGTLRMVLMHRPGVEMEQITMDKWNDEVGAIIGENRLWYWRDKCEPDLALMQKEHDNYVKIFQDAGVEVVYLDRPDPTRPKAVNTRDFGVAVPGGFLLGRFAPAMRRGEEVVCSRTVAGLGCPIVKTITGTGTFEGGNFTYIDSKHVAVGYSSRTNEEGIRQLKEVFEPLGIEVVVVPMTGYALHIDGAFCMVDHETALVNVTKLPYFFLEKLKSLGIKMIHVHPEDDWYSINCVALKPGKLIMTTGSDRTVERLNQNGIEVIQMEYSEIMKNGGGPHCSCLPLVRDYI